MAEASAADKAPLDEVMLAMDVVDTLRHRERLIERELGAADREHELMQRLREIYASQGIEVGDHVLAEGVRALREERFAYTAPEPGAGRAFAVAYATRGRWGKWVGAAAGIVAAILLAYQLGVRGPQLREIEALPVELGIAQQAIVDVAAETRAVDEAERLAAAGEAALERGEYADARDALAELRTLRANLEREYELRIVSRPGELSGVWRIPEENPAAQNYYLIVEPIAPDGAAIRLPVRNEEDGRTREVTRFGLRVDEETFQRVARDKQDDGIIQNDVVGVKRRGELEPQYQIATTGATITQW
jgi:hypothetical protein